MSYNNNQYPYYPQNAYNQSSNANNTYNNTYGSSGQTRSSGSYYQQNNLGSQSNAQYAGAPNQGYTAGGNNQQDNDSIADTQQSGSMTYMGSYGGMNSYNQSGYQATPTSQTSAMNYSAGTGRSSPAMAFGTSRTTDNNSGTNNYPATSGFSQSAARSTAQASTPQYSSLYSTAQSAQNTVATSNELQQGYNRAYQSTPQQSLNASSANTTQTYQANSGRASSYVSPTMQTNPQLAQSHNKNSQPTTHSRTPSGMAAGPPPPVRPASNTQMRPSQVPHERPSSTDPSTIQATMQQLAQVPWQERSQSQTPLQTQTQGYAPPQTQTQIGVYAPTQPQPAAMESPVPQAASRGKAAKKRGRPSGSKNAPKDPNAPPKAKAKAKKQAANAESPAAKGASSTDQPQAAPADDMTDMFAKMAQMRQTDPAKFAQLMAQFSGDTPTQPAAAATPAANVSAAPTTKTSTPQTAVSGTSKKATPNKQGSASKKKGSSFVDLTGSTASKVQERVAQSKAAGRGTDKWTPSSGLPPYESASAQTQTAGAVPPIPTEYQKSQSTATSTQPTTVTAQRPDSSQSGAAPGATNSAGGTFWPEDRRQGLAVATKRFLEAVPQNTNKTVNIHDVHQLLEQNPSYEQLCQILEGQGWAFQRSKFAQHLIATINSRERQQPANISRPLMPPQNNVVRPGDYQRSPFQSMRSPPIAEQTQDSHTVRPSDISVTPANAALPVQDSPAQAAPQFFDPTTEAPPIAPPDRMAPMKTSRSSSDVKPVASPAIQTPAPEPRNKEEAARKRTFADFVDLTEQDEEDEAELELERERKRRALEQPVERFVERLAPQEPPRPSPWQQAAQRFDRFRNQQGVSGMTSAREALKNEIVVRPLDHAKAKRTSRYDPKTIARDFFLAKGEHPTLKPLNHHYEKLFSTFSSVKIDSDLETFRWDLVDPGEPIPDPDKPTREKAAQSTSSDRGEHKSSQGYREIARSAGNGYAGSDDEEVVGTMLPFKESNRGKARDGSVIPGTLERMEGQEEGNGEGLFGNQDSESERPSRGPRIANAAPGQLSSHLTAIKVPPVPSNFHDVAARMDRGETLPSNQPAYSMAGLGSIRRGRPPKRGRGRPSRGAGLTRADSTSFQRASTPPHSSAQTPTSFTPINKPVSTTHSKSAASRNAIDDISAGGLNALEPTQKSGKRGPGRPRTSTPMSNPLSVVVPTSGSGLLDKHGNPAKTYSSGKRLGRPPGSKNKFPSDTAASALDRGSPSVRGSSDAPPKKKRGRPLGFRPGPRGSSIRGRGRGRVRAARPRVFQKRTTMPRDGVGVLLPAIDVKRLRLSWVEALDKSEPRDRRWGKDDTQHHSHPSEYPATNKYPVFRCRWHGCTSQLHNMDTLRKHVEKIHFKRYNLDPEVVLECLWRGCCHDSSVKGGVHEKAAVPATGKIFETLAELETHMEGVHLSEVVWKQGDGPTVYPTIHNPTTYLNDPITGATVTPTALPPGSAPPDPLLDLTDPVIPRENRAQFIKAYHKAHGNISKAAKARAKILSRRAWAEDEDRLNAQGANGVSELPSVANARKWRQMNMDGVRVEVPLSDRAKARLGWRRRDAGAENGEANRGAELEEEGEEERLKRLAREWGERSSDEDMSDIEDSDDDTIGLEGDEPDVIQGSMPPDENAILEDEDDEPAITFTSPNRSGMMGSGMLAPKTIQATGDVPASEDDDSDEDGPMIQIRSSQNYSYDGIEERHGVERNSDVQQRMQLQQQQKQHVQQLQHSYEYQPAEMVPETDDGDGDEDSEGDFYYAMPMMAVRRGEQ